MEFFTSSALIGPSCSMPTLVVKDNFTFNFWRLCRVSVVEQLAARFLRCQKRKRNSFWIFILASATLRDRKAYTCGSSSKNPRAHSLLSPHFLFRRRLTPGQRFSSSDSRAVYFLHHHTTRLNLEFFLKLFYCSARSKKIPVTVG